MKVRLLSDQEGPSGKQPAGTEIEHADAHRLVELGIAEPVDDEAKQFANLRQMFREEREEIRQREQREQRARIVARQEEALRIRREAFAQQLGVEPAAPAETKPPRKK